MILDSFFSLGIKLRSQYQKYSSSTILACRDKCDKFYKSNNNNNKTSNIAFMLLVRSSIDDHIHEKKTVSVIQNELVQINR